MEPGKLNDSELNGLISHALATDGMLNVPTGLSEKFLRKMEKRLILKELLVELSLKLGIIVGSLLVLAGVFLLLNNIDVFALLKNLFLNNWQLISSVLLLAFITILIDQVGIKYLAATLRQVDLKV